MKKLLSFLPMLVLVAACGAPKTNRDGAVSSTNKAAEIKPTTSVPQAEIEAREKAIWEAIQKKNYDAFANMLSSDHLEVEADGIYDKTAIIANVKDINISDITFSDWKMLSIDKDAVIIMYNVTANWTYKGQVVPPGPYRAASAWVNRDGKWLDIYYQQTAVDTTPHPPPPSASQPAKAAASPAAKIAEAGPDPIANEKLVWDTFRSRNYDAFAAFLASDFVEVETDALYDKAGAVKAVGRFDASKAELTDWKTVKFDNEASAVTFVVKLPGAPRERHSTIWVNRNGKWMALFHQGTPETTTGTRPAATQ